MEKWTTLQWIADQLGISRQRVHRLKCEGRIPAVYINGHWWVRVDLAREFIARHRSNNRTQLEELDFEENLGSDELRKAVEILEESGELGEVILWALADAERNEGNGIAA
jgi:hypothetical protein